MKKQKKSKQRQEIFNLVQKARNHPTATQIYHALRQKSPNLSRGTVYRNLNLLAKNGEVQQVETPSADRFDWKLTPHYHLLCTACGALLDTDIPYQTKLDAALAQVTGYQSIRHRTMFEGVCLACQARESDKTHRVPQTKDAKPEPIIS